METAMGESAATDVVTMLAVVSINPSKSDGFMREVCSGRTIKLRSSLGWIFHFWGLCSPHS
jgi:hypothetical protein